MPKLEIHYDTGNWAALYVDGNLERIGDSYLAEELAFEILGVTIVRDASFMRGQSQADGVARTLDDVAAYRAQRDEKWATAEQLRAEAARLLAEAKELES